MDHHSESDARRRRRNRRLVGAVVTASALFAGLAPGAGAAANVSPPLADGLIGPLSIDVTGNGDVLVGQAFAGIVSRVAKNGTVTDLVADPGATAVAAGPFGTVLYTVRPEEGQASLKIRLPGGQTRTLADLGAYEAAHNPDAGNAYGVQGISDDCAAQWPVEQFGPAAYPGQIDSNPYAIAVAPWGVYVADAGGNAILSVDWFGHVRTVAVLPPQPLQLPPDPTMMGLPACVAGLTYNFEPVPTDIELSWSGAFVSLLPGGPEDASLGARGSVVKLNLLTGRTRTVAGGFLGATDLAVSPGGDVYVAELFGGRVSKVTPSGPATVAELPTPAALEWARGKLYVAYDAFDSGKIATITP